VHNLLKQRIQRHQFARRTVLWNLPPAYARHWRIAPYGTSSASSAPKNLKRDES